MTLTIEEAKGKYEAVLKDAHCFDAVECQMCAEDKVALDAVVKDAMLAAACAASSLRVCDERVLFEVKAEIERLFGSEGGTG